MFFTFPETTDAELSFDMLELLIEIIAVKKMCSSSGHIGGEYSTYNSWSGGFLWGGLKILGSSR